MATVPSTGKTRTPTTLCSFAFRVMKSPEDGLLSAWEPSDMPVNFLAASGDLGRAGRFPAAITHLLYRFCRSQLSATFTIPIWQWFLTRFGKKTAVYVGISVSGAQGGGGLGLRRVCGEGLADGSCPADPPSSFSVLVSSPLSHLGGPHEE